MWTRAGIAETSAAGLVVLAVLAAVTLGGGGACGSPSSCPSDAPTECPSPVPSFSGEVQAIFLHKCGECHAPGGVKADTPFLTYAQISPSATRTSILVRVERCEMPQPGAPPLTEEERLALLGWLVCKGPNN